ncbi:MAG: NADH pyrophosphatase NudC, Nudix superfamily [Chloroflexi bacterium]|jgi:ADP-ribose pyrophosphatase YjhB (NUDIX family)|nr:MAG: NADH pyrophosphatase NudC, Nudix superfamily [Chloroflexota bacterium]|tara:strand:+ start:2065 stop:3048 length:984 start_codon:yes stop_codon:yes gene_type:complete
MNINQINIQFCTECGTKLHKKATSGSPMQCPKCNKMIYIEPKVAVGAVVLNNNKEILLVKRNTEPFIGQWSFPAGFVNPGELIENALMREVLEETAIKIEVQNLLGVHATKNEQVIFIAYQAKAKSEKIFISNEIQEATFFNMKKLPKLAFQHDGAIIKKIITDSINIEEKNIFNLSLLQKRGIEADVLIPFIRNLENKLGKKQAHKLAQSAIKEIAKKQGDQFSKAMNRNDLKGFKEIQDTWSGAGNDIIFEILKEDESTLDFNVSRCRFAEMYKQLGAPDLGYILSCGRDFSLSEGYSDKIHLSRSQTIMEGADFCDFRYSKKDQ